MRRRDFVKAIAGSATAWPLAAHAQQPAMPVVSLINGATAEIQSSNAAAFRRGLGELGYLDSQNVTIDYHWLEGRYDQLPSVMADLTRRNVAVIAILDTLATLAAKAATATIPIVFGVNENPVPLGLVASLARPGGNATGINFFFVEVTAKRLRLLHDLVPKATRIAVLVNPAAALTADSTVQELEKAAPAMGLQIQTVLKATTVSEIDAAFEQFARDRPDALFVAPDGLFFSRAVQLVTLTARDRIPATYSNRAIVAAGGLMSYGPDLADAFYHVGVYAGRILKGEKPAEMPVLQSTKFAFVINLQTARALGIEVPSGVLSIADEVIE